MISDDNFKFFQRTEFVEFAVTDDHCGLNGPTDLRDGLRKQGAVMALASPTGGQVSATL